MFHPLEKILHQMLHNEDNFWNREKMSQAICDYLRERSGWLKGFLSSDKNDYISQAFELEQEEQYCMCSMSGGVFAPENIIKCCTCGKPLKGQIVKPKETKPELPEKFSPKGHLDDVSPIIKKINEIIDYLAEERERR